ncbi:MAG: Hsp20/alpha crystallin family protein [bacterium]
MMDLVKWEPFRGLLDIREEMNRLFEDFFGRKGIREWMPERWSPSVDLSETSDAFILKADLPGLTHKDIHVSLTNNILTLSGEKKQEKEEKGETYHRIERAYGSFSRSFTLPSEVKADKIDAKFKDGVLTITMPKSERAKSREIQVKVE